MVDDALYYVPLISLAVVSGLFILALINFSAARKIFQIRTEQQMNILKMEVMQTVYERILEMRIRLENNDEFIGLAQESPLFAERFAAAGTPAQYFTIMAFIDIFEYVFYLSKKNLIDDMIWERWKIIIETMLSIPRFQLVWEKTKLSRPGSEFRDFIDSFK
ncbi:MAG: hypothetical protein ACRD8W_07070 [Nitrososphaeraceae archaeon]